MACVFAAAAWGTFQAVSGYGGYVMGRRMYINVHGRQNSRKMESKYTTLLLDIDGTLLDFAAAEHQAFGKAMSLHGFTATDEEYRLYSGINKALWEAFERGEVEREELLVLRFRRLLEALQRNGDPVLIEQDYQRLLGECAVLMDGAEEILSYLAPKYALYVVTNGVEETQRNRLRLSGIERYMDGVFISESIGYQKPQKEFFDCCFAQIPEKGKDRFLIIGDSFTSDIQGGINAGIDTCWFHPTGEPGTDKIQTRKVREGFLDLEIGSLHDLMELL